MSRAAGLLWGSMILVVFSLGCAGRAIFGLAAEGELQGPVSLTGVVLAPDGHPLQFGDGLERIALFEERRRFWGLFMIGLNSSDWDVTDVVNAALEDSGGEAIVNLDVEAKGCPYIALATLIPIIPSYVELTIRGDIARRAPVPPDSHEP